ncbi:MAG: hypothetical protein U9Q98_05740 [Bacteroidota bacterium]|nr:hypothetical protein [Bacteroidota bacterium]
MIIYENGKREKFKKKHQTEKSEKLENDKETKEADYESSKKHKNILGQGLYINIQGGYDFALSTQNSNNFY